MGKQLGFAGLVRSVGHLGLARRMKLVGLAGGLGTRRVRRAPGAYECGARRVCRAHRLRGAPGFPRTRLAGHVLRLRQAPPQACARCRS